MNRINMGVHSMKNLEDTETFLLDQDATRNEVTRILIQGNMRRAARLAC